MSNGNKVSDGTVSTGLSGQRMVNNMRSTADNRFGEALFNRALLLQKQLFLVEDLRNTLLVSARVLLNPNNFETLRDTTSNCHAWLKIAQTLVKNNSDQHDATEQKQLLQRYRPRVEKHLGRQADLIELLPDALQVTATQLKEACENLYSSITSAAESKKN